MPDKIGSMIRCNRALLVAFFLVASAAACFADPYADQGTVFITGTITQIQGQQVCNQYDCHIGSTWTLAMTFLAPDWNAPGSHYIINAAFLNCIGGPPCFTDYRVNSDFGWGPYLFDDMSVDIENGEVVDARASDAGYFIEWGEANSWDYVIGFSGTTSGYAIPTPEPATILMSAGGALLSGVRRRLRVAR